MQRPTNIETAFAVLDLEQLKGTGRIGGLLPLRIEGGKVSVEKGHLESSVPGTLQVGVTALADKLQTYGENVDMAFRALTDFHYDRMVIDADKPFSGAGKAMFRLEGNNPKVMEGQPFVFNRESVIQKGAVTAGAALHPLIMEQLRHWASQQNRPSAT